MKKYIDEHLGKVFIRPSSSAAAALISDIAAESSARRGRQEGLGSKSYSASTYFPLASVNIPSFVSLGRKSQIIKLYNLIRPKFATAQGHLAQLAKSKFGQAIVTSTSQITRWLFESGSLQGFKFPEYFSLIAALWEIFLLRFLKQYCCFCFFLFCHRVASPLQILFSCMNCYRLEVGGWRSSKDDFCWKCQPYSSQLFLAQGLS